ncbi:MAG: FtsX-like permease family protein, partial [Balneolaceae bacterium]|nr:FtsX-like permease family protein [Balneolaceae bacterium]
LDTFQEEIERLPGVEVTSAMSGTPGGFFDNNRFRIGEQWEKTHVMKALFTDHHFSEVLELEMLAGRDFDLSHSSDPEKAAILNKAAVDKFGWTPDEALGKRIQNQFMDTTARRIIGVVENFHYESLHQEIAPLVVAMNPDRREILIKVETGNLDGTLASIEKEWDAFSPLFPMEYSFLDQQFAQLYEDDKRQRTVFTAFSIAAIFIACMGLFSLAVFNSEKRRKEMGVRKVMGAKFTDILLLFNREILAVIVVAFLLAVPAAYLWAEQWLADYAYRIPNGMWNYLLGGLVIIALAVFTVSYQSLKVARMNPVKSLRSE